MNVCGGEAKNIKYLIWVICCLFFKNKKGLFVDLS